MRFFVTASLLVLCSYGCAVRDIEVVPPLPVSATAPYVVVLGIAQDGGYPQAGCTRDDCAAAWRDASLRHRVAALGIVDPVSGQRDRVQMWTAALDALMR